jgi:hypothetical protein
VDLVLNKCQDEGDERKARELTETKFDRVHLLPWDPAVREHEPDVSPLVETGGRYVDGVKRLMDTLER